MHDRQAIGDAERAVIIGTDDTDDHLAGGIDAECRRLRLGEDPDGHRRRSGERISLDRHDHRESVTTMASPKMKRPATVTSTSTGVANGAWRSSSTARSPAVRSIVVVNTPPAGSTRSLATVRALSRCLVGDAMAGHDGIDAEASPGRVGQVERAENRLVDGGSAPDRSRVGGGATTVSPR